MDDAQIRAMVSYTVDYLNKNCLEQLETMLHLIDHDESHRKRVTEITEAIIDYHDKLLMERGIGKKIEDLAPEYAKQCKTYLTNTSLNIQNQIKVLFLAPHFVFSAPQEVFNLSV